MRHQADKLDVTVKFRSLKALVLRAHHHKGSFGDSLAGDPEQVAIETIIQGAHVKDSRVRKGREFAWLGGWSCQAIKLDATGKKLKAGKPLRVAVAEVSGACKAKIALAD
jgi:hypothetical protein